MIVSLEIECLAPWLYVYVYCCGIAIYMISWERTQFSDLIDDIKSIWNFSPKPCTNATVGSPVSGNSNKSVVFFWLALLDHIRRCRRYSVNEFGRLSFWANYSIVILICISSRAAGDRLSLGDILVTPGEYAEKHITYTRRLVVRHL